jgi:hypothetical protein
LPDEEQVTSIPCVDDPPNSPPDIEVKAIPMFFRIGPVTLILGSVCSVWTVMFLSEALRWTNLQRGLEGSVVMVMLFGLPLIIFLLVVQGWLACILMSRGRRGWWRTSLVLLPAALLVLFRLFGIIELYPPERRARNELGRFLGKPLSESAANVSMSFVGGIGPIWEFQFDATSQDYERIKRSKDFEPAGDSRRSPSTLQVIEGGYLYYLDYDPASSRCSFWALTHF